MTTIDLLPRELKERTRRRRMLLGAGVVALLLLTGLVVGRLELSRQVKAWEERRARVEAERAGLARLADKKAEIARLEQLLQEGTAPRGGIPPWGELLWFLGRVTPPQVVLRELRWDGTALSLSGEASDLAAMAVLVRALEGCPYLERVAVTQVTRGERKGPVVFAVAATWRSR